jgi:hypothetical protein
MGSNVFCADFYICIPRSVVKPFRKETWEPILVAEIFVCLFEPASGITEIAYSAYP